MPGTSRPLLSVSPDAWRHAYQLSLLNAMIFVVLAWAQYVMEPTSLWAILSVPGLFFVGSTLSFVLLILSGGVFAAMAWFILGAGIYFGLGVFIGGVAPDPRGIHYGLESVLLNDLLRINVLNSSSIALVLLTAVPLAYRPKTARRTPATTRLEMHELLLRLFPSMAVLALVSVGFQFIFFPVATNLTVRTLLASAYLVVPFYLLTLGMVWSRLKFNWAALGVVVFLLAVTLSLLTMSKFSVMSNLVALVIGTWVYRRSLWSVAGGLLMLGAIYTYTGALMTEGRSHIAYDATSNSALTRLVILGHTFAGSSQEDQTSVPIQDISVPTTLTRLSTAEIQAYLIDQYDEQQPGTSLNDLWVAAIPRILWPDKPIVTRFGTELHEQFWATADATSALAPTYTAEAYWNYGPVGVVVISILIGLEIGWLTQRWHMAAEGLDLAFFVIAFPTALWSSFVESWIAATYIGGFLTLVLLWSLCRFLLLKLFVGALPPARATLAH